MTSASETAKVNQCVASQLQNFDTRKTARAGEIEGLNNAKAVLAGADYSFFQQRKWIGEFSFAPPVIDLFSFGVCEHVSSQPSLHALCVSTLSTVSQHKHISRAFSLFVFLRISLHACTQQLTDQQH